MQQHKMPLIKNNHHHIEFFATDACAHPRYVIFDNEPLAFAKFPKLSFFLQILFFFPSSFSF